MLRRMPLSLALVALSIAHPADAAAKKPVGKSASQPVTKTPEPAAAPIAPAVPPVPAAPGGFMVPKAVVLKSPTPAEVQANAVWNVRAALNVAALQCQFSPFLATVKNYNDMLKHHGEELVQAQATMLAHFRRTDGARAANSFDQYTTRTYNSYSTLDAQYNFCEAAGLVGRAVLAVPKGQLGATALQRNSQVRESLIERPLAPALAVVAMEPLVLLPIEAP